MVLPNAVAVAVAGAGEVDRPENGDWKTGVTPVRGGPLAGVVAMLANGVCVGAAVVFGLTPTMFWNGDVNPPGAAVPVPDVTVSAGGGGEGEGVAPFGATTKFGIGNIIANEKRGDTIERIDPNDRNESYLKGE